MIAMHREQALHRRACYHATAATARLCAIIVLLFAGVSPAHSATGHILRTIYATPAPYCGVTVGIAFDGSELLVSCIYNQTITRVSPADGSVLGAYTVSGMGGDGIGAMSWDSKNSMLWVGTYSYPERVYAIALDKNAGTGTATLKFAHTGFSYGLTDGIAYDGTDDTIWFSTDVSPYVYHYDLSGNTLGSFDVAAKLGGCGNSGIAVAGPDTLYFGNNGCAGIYVGSKSGDPITLFASLIYKRVEDLECDNRTFAPRSVIWSKDAYDYELNAFEVPAGECAEGGVVAANAPPVLTLAAPVDGALYAVGSSVSVTGTFTDPDSADSHTCEIAWGSAAAVAGVVAESSGAGACTGSNAFSSPGVYTITMTVEDGAGATDAKSVMIVVYDPNGGFVTGGGWFMSPPGALVSDSSLTGRANFGFVAKYLKGANVPTGQTEFKFSTAGVNFHSSTYQWLVVSGARAQYKGTGTLNGEPGYGFLLTAVDGQLTGGGGVDKFRIKIWDATEAVVYDNLVDAPDTESPTSIDGGSIVIHKK